MPAKHMKINTGKAGEIATDQAERSVANVKAVFLFLK